MSNIDDFFNSITYTKDEAGQAAQARNEAIRALDNLENAGADAATVQQATAKVAAAATTFNQVLTHPRVLTQPVLPASSTTTKVQDVYTYTPSQGVPKLSFPRITSKVVVVPTGEPISTAVLTAIATVFAIFGFSTTAAIKKAVEAIRIALKDVSNTLINIIWTFAHNMRWILNALRWIWERVLSPLIDEIGQAIGRIAVIIERVLKPYLDLIDKIRKHILEIYARWFLPIISFLQKVRQIVAILRLLHVPGMKQLDEKIARVEGKIIGTLQQIMYALNNQGGLMNILMTARMTIQHGVLVRSLYETQGAWINQWWNAQEWDRSAEDAEAGVQLDLQIQAQPHVKQLDALLSQGVYTRIDTPGPHEQELDALLRRGAA
jgi:hypothetical protein